MTSLIIRFVVMTVAVLIAASIIPGLRIENPVIAFVTAVVLSLLNMFIRPILVLLTLPINVVTLGLFLLVINGLLLWATGGLIRGFEVANFGAAFLGALVISIVATLLNLLVGGNKGDKDK